MNRQYKVIGTIILSLIALGVLVQLVRKPAAMIIPLAVFGIIFYFYKFPPKQYRKGASLFSSGRAKTRSAKRKTNPFRVIKGNKKEEEDPPRYH